MESRAARVILIAASLLITAFFALWGVIDPQGMAAWARTVTTRAFESRGWFIMLTVTAILVGCILLAVSRFGRVRLGPDDSKPEFSTLSWLAMLFSAGMGVGLLFWGVAEPVSHHIFISEFQPPREAAVSALFVTNFHWGMHAWAIYAATGLAVAYFGFRRGEGTLISGAFLNTFPDDRWAGVVGWLANLVAIVAVAIGVAGSVAMGVFQVERGAQEVVGAAPGELTMFVFALLFVGWMVPLMVDLRRGMAVIANATMLGAVALMLFILLAGPTHYMMNSITESVGIYLWNAFEHGLRLFTFGDWRTREWFREWTLTYMVWWIAWAPFVGVFIARISRGRTIREFVLGVILVPTVFSVMWFGVFGGAAFNLIFDRLSNLSFIVENDLEAALFHMLSVYPLGAVTRVVAAVIAFLFVITSVVSASYVLAMFTSDGDPDPRVRLKLTWGALLGALGLAMVLSGGIEAVRAVTALGAMPFVFIILMLGVCLIRSLKREEEGE